MKIKIRKIQGITRRIRPKDEVWFLRIRNKEVLVFKTQTKRERNILSAIRKVLIAFKYNDIDLTNREKYVKNLNVSQSKLMKMKANNKFLEKGVREMKEELKTLRDLEEDPTKDSKIIEDKN